MFLLSSQFCCPSKPKALCIHSATNMEKNQPSDIFYMISGTDQPTQEESTLYNTVPDELCPISTELSLSTGLVSKAKHGSTSRTHKFGASKRNRGKRFNNSKPNPRNNVAGRKRSAYSSCSSKEKQYWGYSTTLKLYEDPWKVKKSLTASDLGKLNRLLLGTDTVESLMLPVLGDDAQKDAQSEIGTAIRVWDVDTMSMHQLVLKRWASFSSYVLIGTWTQEFVKRRGLKKGDEIGLHWDSYRSCFNFSVLNRAMEN